MAIQSAPVQLSVVPDAQLHKEIQNALDAPKKLSDALAELKKKLAEIDPELGQALSNDLAAGPLNIDSAVEKHKAAKAKREALKARIEAIEELRVIVEARIKDLKAEQPAAVRSIIEARLKQLQDEASAEKEKEHLLKEQIDALRAHLKDLEGHAAKAKA